MPVSRRLKVQLVSLVGFAAALYARHVEHSMDEDPFYVPACNSAFLGGNCGAVFKSEYGRILSHWGVVPQGHALDFSLATTGILLYGAYFVAITFRRPWTVIPFREEMFLAVATVGACFSCYLLYVIKYVLNDFCIVCTTFHLCNFSMLVLAALEYRSPEMKKRGKRKRS